MPSKRYVTLPNRHQVSLGAYVDAWKQTRRLASANPQLVIHDFNDFATRVGDVLEAFRYGMEDRINKHDPAYGKGRKWDDDYQRELSRAARQLNTPRLAIDWLPKDLRARFVHRLREERRRDHDDTI